MEKKNLRLRLIIFIFLEFAVWGSYLTSLGNFLAHAGLAPYIFWFYTIQGIVTLFMPMFMGYLADRLISGKLVVFGCQMMSAILKGLSLLYCLTVDEIHFLPLFLLFGASIAFYIPTIGLGNAIILGILKQGRENTVRLFPAIRIFGTVGFIAAMLMVNFISIDGIRMQTSPWQIGLAALFSLITGVYALTLPSEKRSVDESSKMSNISYLTLVRNKYVLSFLIFSFLIGICLQITNSYGNNFITSFTQLPHYASTWGAQNANAIISISQISETLCILLIPFCLGRLGIKRVIAISAMAWCLRFGLLGIGNTGSGLIYIIMSMVIYGIAFDFLNIAGAIYIDRIVDSRAVNRAQSLFMLVTGGMGAAIGTPLAGMVVNHFVFSQTEPINQLQGWQTSWFIFAAYALLLCVLVLLFFRCKSPKIDETL